MADLVLALAERQGLPDLAANALLTLGTAAFYSGRQWQARALVEGARKIAEEAALTETLVPRARRCCPRSPPSTTRAGRSRPSATGSPSPGARATGPARTASSTTPSRTRAGPATGTGRSRELAAIGQLDIDESSLVGNRAQQVFFEVYRGTFDGAELPELRRRIEVLEDRDLALRAGRDRRRHRACRRRLGRRGQGLDGGRRCQRPQRALQPAAGRPRGDPRAATPATAQAAVDRLAAIGTQGSRDRRRPRRDPRRPRGARRGSRRPLAGLPRGARRRTGTSGCRGTRRWRAWRRAQWLGDGDAELAAWTETSRATFTRLGAVAAPRPARRSDRARQRGRGDRCGRRARAGGPQAAASADASVSIGEG